MKVVIIMKKTLLLFVILLSMLITGCSQTPKVDSNNDFGTIITDPPSEHTIDCYSALLKDSYVYFSLADDNTVVFYRTYFDGKSVKIGEVDDYVFNLGIHTISDNTLYFYITTAESQAAVFEKNEYKNIIYKIDLTTNVLNEVYSESYCLPGAIISSVGEYLVSRQSHRSEDNQLSTYIELYNIRTGVVEKRSEVFVLDDNTNVGTYMINMCADNENIYAIVDKRYQDGTNDAKIHKYNTDMELIDTINLGDISNYILTSRIATMHVFDDCVYLKNYSGDAVVGIVKDNTISEIAKGKGLEIAIQHDDHTPVFYLKGNTSVFFYNSEKKNLDSVELETENDYLIKSIMACDEKLLVTLFAYASSPDEVFNDRIYWVDKNNVQSIH